VTYIEVHSWDAAAAATVAAAPSVGGLWRLSCSHEMPAPTPGPTSTTKARACGLSNATADALLRVLQPAEKSFASLKPDGAEPSSLMLLDSMLPERKEDDDTADADTLEELLSPQKTRGARGSSADLTTTRSLGGHDAEDR